MREGDPCPLEAHTWQGLVSSYVLKSVLCHEVYCHRFVVYAAMSKRFYGQSALYALATVAPILVNLAVTPFVTRVLGSEDYGLVAVSITLFQFGVVLFTFGLAASITRQAIIEESGTAGAVATVLQGAVCAVVLYGLADILLPAWGGLLLPAEHVGILAGPLISCLGLAFLQNAQSLYRAEQRVLSFVAFSAAASIIAPAAGLLLLVTVERSPWIYVAGLAATHFAVGVAAIAECIRLRKPKFVRGDFLRSIVVGIPTVPHQLASSFLVVALVSLASNSMGLVAAGALQIGLLIGSAPILLIGAMNNAWAPLIYRTSDQQRGEVLRSTFRGFMILTAILVLGFSVAVPVVVPFVAGPVAVSMPVVEVAFVAAAGAPFMTLYLANIHLVFHSGKTGALAFTTPISAAIAVGTVVSANQLLGASDVRVLAAAVPLFYLMQWMVSIQLRRTRSDLSVPVSVVLVELFIIAGVLAVALLAPGDHFIILASAILLATGLALYRLTHIRRYIETRKARADVA